MTWFRVDDGFPTSSKVLAIPRPTRAQAVGAWCLAGSWASANLTDGFVPCHVLSELSLTAKQAQALVDAGLWDVVEGGYQFHDWSDYQPTRANVLDKREKTREKVRTWRERNRVTQTGSNPVTSEPVTGYQEPCNPVSNPAPYPTRPDPTLIREKTSSPTATDTDFEAFWKLYPRKVGKGQAVKAYRRARRDVDAERILSSLRVYVHAMQGQDANYVKHPATWLNAQSWHDDPEAIAPAHVPRIGNWQAERDAMFADAYAWAEQHDAQNSTTPRAITR